VPYPIVPGHEVAGVIDAVGSGVDPEDWRPGQRVGVGWHGGHCGRCTPCGRGDFITCIRLKIPGISMGAATPSA
jgi:D-arabinose 1-dehydrogenase-like Zn-dependent alcohol dehydrogenase